MFAKSAELYDLIYADMKDYAAEAGAIASLLRQHCPAAHEILDVACGTGEHARALGALGYAVDGVDIEPVFVEIARAKNPGGRFVQGDMAELDLRRRYDAVLCLFSSIAYLKTSERVTQALRAFAAHLAPGGVILVEPWFTPDDWKPGAIYQKGGVDESRHVVRMSYSGVRGRISTLEFHYLVGRDGHGIEHRVEHHELGLFTVPEMEAAFTAAGLSVHRDAAGLTGRGLYIARHATAGTPAALP